MIFFCLVPGVGQYFLKALASSILSGIKTTEEIEKMFIDDNCAGCGLCVESCPVEAITLLDNKAVIDKAICIECASCIDVCPFEAIHQEE